MPIQEGRVFAQKMGGQLHPVPDCGHSPHLELDDIGLSNHVINPIKAFWANVERAQQEEEVETLSAVLSEA
jgi:pimeloyl-ACP methyl ester carboxylesterase